MVRFYIVVNITAIKCGNVTYLPFPLLCASGSSERSAGGDGAHGADTAGA